MQARDDETLLRAYAREGDEAAFRELARRYGGLVYGACLRDVRRADLAEDAAQAVFLDLARKAGRIRPKTSLVPWLYAAPRFASRNVLRAERRRPTVPLDESIPAPAGTPDDALFQALDALSAPEREAVVLRFVQGLSLAEVGRAQGVSEDAARMRVQRALKRLRTEYVPALTAPMSLAERLAVLALPRPLSPMTIPLLLASGGLAALAVVGAATHRPASPTAPPASPLASQAKPAPPMARPSALVNTKPSKVGPASEFPSLDRPFTLKYHVVERDLRTKAMRDEEVAVSRRQMRPHVDAGQMTAEDMDGQLASIQRLSPTVERDVVLSYDGRTLYVGSESPGVPKIFLVRGRSSYEFSPGASKYWPSFHDGYSLYVVPVPPLGASLPYLPFVQSGKTFQAELVAMSDGKPVYSDGRIETQRGKVVRIVNQGAKAKRAWALTTLSGHHKVAGRMVAGHVVYRVQDQKGRPSRAKDFRLISASDAPLSADRFVPEAYLPEKAGFFVDRGGQGRTFDYERTKGSLDAQVQAFIAGGGR